MTCNVLKLFQDLKSQVFGEKTVRSTTEAAQMADRKKKRKADDENLGILASSQMSATKLPTRTVEKRSKTVAKVSAGPKMVRKGTVTPRARLPRAAKLK